MPIPIPGGGSALPADNVTGTGTPNHLAKWSGAHVLADSFLTEFAPAPDIAVDGTAHRWFTTPPLALTLSQLVVLSATARHPAPDGRSVSWLYTFQVALVGGTPQLAYAQQLRMDPHNLGYVLALSFVGGALRATLTTAATVVTAGGYHAQPTTA